MIVSDVKVPVGYTGEELKKAIRKASGKRDLKIKNYTILKRSVDARKKPALFYVMKLLVNEELPPLKRSGLKREESDRVLVCGAGPCGLFAALTLLEEGRPVLILERGKKVEDREKDVEKFFSTGILNPESNVQFGEGGAGTFSDGKLNTRTRDEGGLNRRVLETFVSAGAAETILYDQRPHIWTDALRKIIINIRNRILSLGGEIRFETALTDILVRDGRLTGAVLSDGETIPCGHLILAIGHSARDTFSMLYERNLRMEAKSFAVGVRMEHPQEMITMDQYGTLDYEELGAAPYKVTAKAENGRGVYSFCMCPGGYVVNASSEEGYLAVNGMSGSRRDGRNANSAIVVQVSPEDYPGEGPLSGIAFQRELEKKAFEASGGKTPVQLYGDFKENRCSVRYGDVIPDMKGACGFAELHEILPDFITDSLSDAIPKFGRMIKGFDREDAILSAVESRTSSPVRILRDDNMEASVRGIYPAGEGAGYAGGIMSAAMDGIRVAEKLLYED